MMNVQHYWNRLSESAAGRSLLPRSCLLCSARVVKSENRSGLLCSGCHNDLVRNLNPCQVCAEPLSVNGLRLSEGLICPACQSNPPMFERIVAPFLYTYPLNALIQRFKKQDHLLLSRLLADLLVAELTDALADVACHQRPDLIIPVPTHWRTRWQRGFNPAAVLADDLAGKLGIPVMMQVLVKRTFTPSQHRLNRRQRLQNLAHSFEVRAPQRLQGKSLVLIDDVVTTGSTAGVIAALLRDNGAQSVEVWALARTPPKRFQLLDAPEQI